MAEPAVVVRAPAKLTWSLRVTGVRADGYHLLDAEFVSLDLADELHITEGSTGISVSGPYADGVPTDGSNLVARALAVTGRTAAVHVVKNIPHGGGLGGGSADAGAVLRWAGVDDPAIAARLGADVPVLRPRRPRPCRRHRRRADTARVRRPHRHADRAAPGRVDPGRLPGVGCDWADRRPTARTTWSRPRWWSNPRSPTGGTASRPRRGSARSWPAAGPPGSSRVRGIGPVSATTPSTPYGARAHR